MEHGRSPGTGATNTPSAAHTAALGVGDFPQFPGEDFLAHAATQFQEQAEARLANRGLLAVAEGHPPTAVKCIVDVDLTALPELPPSHRDYHRRLESRTKVEAQNTANAEKRTRSGLR